MNSILSTVSLYQCYNKYTLLWYNSFYLLFDIFLLFNLSIILYWSIISNIYAKSETSKIILKCALDTAK
jgi:hypothetical protein